MTEPRVGFITGGASGIGLALGQLLAREGVRVVLADIDDAALNRAVEDQGPQRLIEKIRLDVTDATAVHAALNGTFERFGRLDFVFNNAGVGGTKNAHEATLEQWQRIVDLNLMGVIHGVAAAYPLMIRQGHGHIINTSSISGLIPWPGQTLYNTTKYAIVGLSHSLRLEAAHFGVRVSVVCPGPVQSSIWGTSILGERNPSVRSPPSAMTAARAAEIIWRGVQSNRETIVFPRAAAIWAWIYRLHHGLLKPHFDRHLKQLFAK
ncbi:MAG TPA: SDR family oxidoreductase [Povalibacter sp.]|uniref:SDR family oxidoreductase n=1 Tax=Povalibacter sp. TaxID=1962978 RepID=UPI002CE6FAC8|nr:SDR family oxidoreductase [Povalibacter sp.]HMN46442.1 SDR family oxidoreductase [Povalibacter sp.]